MASASSDKTQVAPVPPRRINGRLVAPCLLPTFSMGRMAPLLRLHLEHYQGPANSPLTVKILELDGYFTLDSHGRKSRIEEGGKNEVLATFKVTPLAAETLDGRPSWSSPKPSDSSLEKVPSRHVPYFRLSFAGKNCPKTDGTQEPELDSPIYYIPLDRAGEEEDGFEIGYEIQDSDGHVQSNLDCNVTKLKLPRCHVPPAHDTAFICGDFALRQSIEGWLNEQYAVSGKDAVQTPSFRQIEKERKEAMQAAAKQAMLELDKYLESSESAYAAHVRNYQDYHKALRVYLDLLNTYERTPELDRRSLDGLLTLRRQEVEKRKLDLDQYLTTTGAIPNSYQEQAEKIRKARERSEALDEFMNHPITRVITFLPGMSVMGAVVKISQGKYLDAFTDVGLDLLTAGSFSKLSQMAKLFTSVTSKEVGSLTALLGYRYLQASLGKLGKIDSLLQLTSRVDPGYEALFDTFKSFKSLKGQGDVVVNLLKSRKSLAGVLALTTRHNFSSAREFIALLKKYQYYDDFLLAVEFFKLYRSGKKVEEKIIRLVDHTTNAPMENSLDALKEPLNELRRLSAYGSILPSSTYAKEAADAVIKFLDDKRIRNIGLLNILLAIPDSDVDLRVKKELLYSRKDSGRASISDPRLNASREELCEMLKKVKEGFRDVVPLRAKEDVDKGVDCFELWDSKLCRWDFGLEALVDKLADQLEARALLMGIEMKIQGWLRGVTIRDPYINGKWWIIHPGWSALGIDYCEQLIDKVSE